MNRKNFLKYAVLSGGAFLIEGTSAFPQTAVVSNNSTGRPLAITMWDFSWLERRWPGAGYENWNIALDELVERGYNAVRIDAYPHLIGSDPTHEWTLVPVWDQWGWGSPGPTKVRVQPALTDFISKCKKRKIKVGLSTWYREDTGNIRMQTVSPEKMAADWVRVLDIIDKENLMDSILYVDLCNEWPHTPWTPFLDIERKEQDWTIPKSVDWMQRAIAVMNKKYPQLSYTFSSAHYEEGVYKNNPAPYLDFIEHHIWMASLNQGEFNNKIGIDWDGFSSEDIKRTVEKAELLYKSDKKYWQDILVKDIKQLASDAKAAGKALMTTESWAIVNYKDYPMLDWEWVKEVCAVGVTTAAATGQWVAMATSNFCGPQFVGMWRDVEWHQKMTSVIKNAPIAEPLMNSKIVKRLKL